VVYYITNLSIYIAEIGEISIAFGNDESEKTEKVRLDFTSRAKFLCYCIQMFVFTIWHKMFPSQKKRWPTQSLWGMYIEQLNL